MENLVKQENGQVVTNSLLVAETFGKTHSNVLRDIKNLRCSEEFKVLNFELMVKMNKLPQGGKQKSQYYIMTKDGFTFLVMGYQGAKAGQFKERYINAFNAMEKKLKEGFTPLSLIEVMQGSIQVLSKHEKQIKALTERVDILEKDKGKTLSLEETEKPKRHRRKRFKVENPTAKGTTRDPFKINGGTWYSVSFIRAMHHLTSKKISISKENRHDLRINGRSIGIVNSEGLKEIARQA